MSWAIAVILALFITGFLLLLLVDAVRQMVRAVASEDWPVVRGTVVTSRVVEKRQPHNSSEIVPVVRYRYQVGETAYESERIAFWGGVSGTFVGTMHARSWTRRWPEGRETDVHYDPEKPDLAVLEPGLNWRTFLSLFVALLLLGLWSGMIWIVTGGG